MLPIKNNCSTCYKLPLNYKDYETTYIGEDTTNAGDNRVSIITCIRCNTKWIHYQLEYYLSKSGRWFRAPISESNLVNITPENTVDYIEKQEFYFYGGSYFNSAGKIGSGKLQLDIW